MGDRDRARCKDKIICVRRKVLLELVVKGPILTPARSASYEQPRLGYTTDSHPRGRRNPRQRDRQSFLHFWRFFGD